MTSAEIVELYEATHGATREGLKNVYVLGSLSQGELLAVSIQQTRAINLVWALLQTRRLEKGSRLAVVGAGAAGLTAAAYAMDHGVHVTTFENRAPLWNLRGCRTRWLHPNMFPRWPEAGWDVTGTQLPVMNWYADYACNVGDLLWSKYKSFESGTGTSSGVMTVRSVSFSPSSDDRRRAQCTLYDRPNEALTLEPFDAVLIAVGFGAEVPRRDAATSVYWLEDALEREDPHRPEMRYLVSGTGDGGLTDLLRIRLQDFRHHHLRDVLLALSGPLRDQILDAERSSVNDRDSSDAYRAIASRTPFAPVLRALRPNTSVILTNLGDVPFPRGKSWRVSRFLAAMLLEHPEGRTRYLGGGGGIVAAESSGDRAPERFWFGAQREEIDAIVIRHGTVPRIGAVLQDLGLTPAQFDAVKDKWKGKITSAPAEWGRDDLDHRRRAVACSVRPALVGRSPIGLLSRLVTLVGPIRQIAGVPEPIRADIVIDRLALDVTSSSERRPVLTPKGWALRGELDRDGLVDTIALIDRSLECLANEHRCVHQARSSCSRCCGRSLADRRRELELHWVLPRHEWLRQPHRTLNNTVAATWWGDYRLRYVDLLGGTPSNWSDHLRRMGRTLDERPWFYAIDINATPSPMRLGLVSSRNAETRRLASELAVEMLIDKMGYEELAQDTSILDNS
jgi:NAD(P)-binding Rossmann-like domain